MRLKRKRFTRKIISKLSKYFVVFAVSVFYIFPAWYSDWSYRKAITNNPAAGGDLTNFPLLLVVSNDNDLSNYASNNGYDILFTLKNGTTKLAHEIEYYSNGTLISWIKIPVLSATEQDSNVIYMYYGKSAAENQQNTSAVWDANYKGVWHLSQDPLGAAPQIHDSTVNNNHGTVKSTPVGNPPVRTLGQTGYCLEFSDESEGKSNWVEIPLVNQPEFTLELWGMRYDVDATRADGFFGGRRWYPDVNSREGYEILIGAGVNNTKFQFVAVVTNADSTNDTGQDYTMGAEINTWHHLTGVINFNAGRKILYQDGKQLISSTLNAGAACKGLISYSVMLIGRSYQNTGYLSGRVDEVRISDQPRSSNWIVTCYSNMVKSITFRELGSVENFPGVIFTSLNPAATPCLVNENTIFIINAAVLTGTVASVNINWGDGQNSSYAPGLTNISSENFSHEYTARNNFTVTAVVTASSGMSATNSTVISTLPYRFYNPYNICFTLEPKGCLIKWNIVSSANVLHFNLYRGNILHERIENSALREYLDENIIFGDHNFYWMEAVYSAGSTISATNESVTHAVYRREAVLGTGGGSLDTLIASLNVPQNSLGAACTISMNILSNKYASFYESGKPVYHQIEIAGSDVQEKIKGGLILKFRVPATNNSLCFKPAEASGYTISAHKNKLFCANWNGSTWTQLSTAVYENRKRNNFSFLELEASVNRPGIYGVMFDPQNTAEKPVTVKNRVFVPGLNDPARSSVQISFPNPDRKQVRIEIYNMNGKLVKEADFTEWLSYWSWDGSGKNREIAESGLYIISITIEGRRSDALNVHCYLLK
ncbi:MAG: hypothetical protein A2096_13295 [Spirochaetes bacterium GWF1_41_5]|nr:MAG: hypothetical protein A2096_13295 [Spirochaetes bacterium GWF1_41_5]